MRSPLKVPLERSLFESSRAGVGLVNPPVRDLPRGEERETSSGDRPPFNWDDWDWGDDGEGGGGDDAGGSSDDSGRGVFAIGLLIFSICTLFAVFLAAFLVLRNNSATWPPQEDIVPPVGLWLSTALIVFSSVCMSRAVSAARDDDGALVSRWLRRTLFLGLTFLVTQALVWDALRAQELLPSTNTYGTIFYALTGLHAVHIVAGLSYLAILAWRVERRESRDRAADSVPACALYWHTMGCIWVVLFAVLYTVP